jgi:hypothetical protein
MLHKHTLSILFLLIKVDLVVIVDENDVVVVEVVFFKNLKRMS